MTLCAIPTVKTINARLLKLFPEGTENRTFVTREMAARTIYVMLYAGAIAGAGRWIRPSHVYFMTEEQEAKTADLDRSDWFTLSTKPGNRPAGKPWYADTTREPVRDETLRSGLVKYGAVVERENVPTTSPLPRYALQAQFAALFNPTLDDAAVSKALEAWRTTYLSKRALTRQTLIKHGAQTALGLITVTFPNNETRALAAGPSSVITQAVIEVFTKKFLKNPAVLWLSESGNKVVARDEALTNALNLKIDPSKALPDIILIDLGDNTGGTDMLVVFVEVVASDGPITRDRKKVLTQLAVEAGFEETHLAFLTAYMDRSGNAFRRSISELAWGSYAWFVSEPEYLIRLHDDDLRTLT